MKKLLLASSIFFLPFLLITIAQANEWRLIWAEEFNYEGRPNQNYWEFEQGIIRKDELGYFTSRPKNVRVENGVLVIEAHKENYLGANYTTGSITTDSKKTFKYGRFEIRAKMPRGLGSHIGIWFHGSNIREVGFPACGEIDLAEYIGRLPHMIHVYNHWAEVSNPSEPITVPITKFTLMNPYEDFHIYAMEWDETQIKYFIDGVHVGTFLLDTAGTGISNPFRKMQDFNLSYSLGGWAWDIDDSVLPQKFEVDYVREYQPAPKPAESFQLTPIKSLLLK